MRFLQDHAADLLKGAVGVSSGVFGVIVTKLDAVEQWLRILASAGAIAVSLFTIWSIWRKNRTP